MITTVKTTDELLALRNSAGVIEIYGYLRIECDVPWGGCGENIAGIRVNDLDCRGNLYCGGNLDCRGNLDCGGNLYCGGEHLIIFGDLKWQLANKPAMPEKNYIRRVVPHEHQRDYWQDRLGIDLSDGCYDELCIKVFKQVSNLLREDKWSSTERWMLETLRDSENPAPGWVNDLLSKKEARHEIPC